MKPDMECFKIMKKRQNGMKRLVTKKKRFLF